MAGVDVVTWPFVVTCVLVVLTPGPSLAVLIDQVLRAGRPAGLVTVAGNTTGLVFWAGASVLGLTALVRASEVAFLVLKVAGAVYLVWLGIQSLRRSRRLRTAATGAATAPETGAATAPREESGPERSGGLLAAYRAGMLTNLSNPKAAALYLALFPQFLPAGAAPLGATATLAAVQMTISASWYVLVTLVIGQVRRLLANPVVRARMDQLTGLVLVGLGVRLATLARGAV
jgi:threonine/homoserine/homoserine lactone efflux protein